jgi:hypothetical protein
VCLTSLDCCVLNLTGRDKGGYYHELFLRSKRFLSHRIQRIKIKGTGARKPSSPDTEPNFYDAPFLPSTIIPSKNTRVSMVSSNMLVSGPNMYLDAGGSLSLRQLRGFRALDASLQHQGQLAPPPLFRSSASLLQQQAQTQAQAQAQFQHQLRMLPFYPETGMGASFGQNHIPMVSGAQHASSAAMALAFSRIEQDQATLARSLSLYGGPLA